MVLDKTGTITRGKPKVVRVVASESIREEELMAYAGSLERLSSHPLAKAIALEAETTNAKNMQVVEGSFEQVRALRVSGLGLGIGPPINIRTQCVQVHNTVHARVWFDLI